MKPISIIIPTHNRAARLANALRSVVTQTSLPAEIVVIDDGSTDNTAQVVERFGDLATVPIHFLRQNNRGPAAARNAGIRRAGSPFIAFLDSDDTWHKKKLEYQYRALAASTEHLISHTKETWYRRGQHLNQKKKHIPRDGYIFDHCLPLCTVGMSTVMVRRELFEKYGLFNESLRCCEDYEMWLRVSRLEHFLLVDHQLTVKHGGRSDQVSQQFKVGMDRFRIQALGLMLKNAPLSVRQRYEVSRILVEKCCIYGTGCEKHGNLPEAEHYLQLANYVRQQVGGFDNDHRMLKP